MSAMDIDSGAPLMIDDDANASALLSDWLDDEPISPCSVINESIFSPAATPRAAAGSHPFAKAFALDTASKFPEPVHVTPDRPDTPFSDDELAALKAFAESPRGAAGPLDDVFFSPPPTPRRPDSMSYLAAAATKPFTHAAMTSDGAQGVAQALARGLAAHTHAPGISGVARKCHALVERAATLPASSADALRDLCGAYPVDEALASLETFVDVAAQEAARAASNNEARRSAWRPLAKWRALHRRNPSGDNTAAAALALWADLSGSKFDAKTRDSAECRAVAGALAAALSAAVTPQDAASADPEQLRALGRGGHAVVKRAFAWTAEDVDAIAAVPSPAGLDRASALVSALQAATTRGKRPAALDLAAVVDGASAEVPLGARATQAKTLLDHVSSNAAQSGTVFMTGVDAYAYDAASFASSARAMRLGRALAASLSPAKPGNVQTFGPDTESQFLWRVDAAATSALAPIATPRGLAMALAARDAMGPNENRVRELQALVADAESSGQARAGWLAPYQISLGNGAIVELRDCAARDPSQRITVIATTLSVVQQV